jgi:phosphatidylglycerol:prolipoprotein diacylglycerol transferase
MHPILFRIPLPHMPLKLWWALVAITAIAFGYAAFAQRKGDKSGALVAAGVGVVAGFGSYFARGVSFESPALPIYSYGVMLGLSLVVGWYLTLTLADRDGLPKETMANCYVVTAVAAIVGSRVLYILTNLDEFKTVTDLFALRKGGLVAYGGFIGGYLGSWAYLARNRIRLMPWADVAVPSLASGLLITRIGCYLFGCDFGKRLSDTAPAFLKKLGTFPHWAQGTLEAGDGSPAYVRHLELFRGTPLGGELTRTNASLPVHPTQIYESLCGLLLLALLLWQRKNQKFRGQIFFTFVFGYGFLRFLLEILRDDVERGEYGPLMGEHVLIPGALLLMSLGFVFGIALGIANPMMRTVARIAAFIPPIVAYVMLKPPSFGASVNTQLSTSQWIGLSTALLVSYFYAQYWEAARKSPRLAMGPESLGPGAVVEEESEKEEREGRGERGEGEDEEASDEEALTETKAEAPKPKKKRKKGLVAKEKEQAETLAEGDEKAAAPGEAADDEKGAPNPAPEG